jgi:hypothetical protein
MSEKDIFGIPDGVERYHKTGTADVWRKSTADWPLAHYGQSAAGLFLRMGNLPSSNSPGFAPGVFFGSRETARRAPAVTVPRTDPEDALL